MIKLPSETSRQDPIYKPAIAPSNDPTRSATFIFVHGLADSAAAIENVADQFRRGGKLPYMNWLLPNARFNRERMDLAWFTPHSLPYTAPSRPELTPDEDEEGMLATVAYLESLIDACVAAGTPVNRIVLGGFSQGCAMSLLTSLTSSKYSGKLAGVVGLLGYLPLVDGKTRLQELRAAAGLDAATLTVPMFLARGTKDDFIPRRAWQYTVETLKGLGIPDEKLEVHVYEELRHRISAPVLLDLCTWLEKVVPE